MPDDLPPGVLRPILLHPDPVLQQRCAPAGYLTGPDLLQLAADMLATMYDAQGRGLAAPQIGLLRRLFVMDAGWKQGAAEPLVLLDPEIIARHGPLEEAEERCLSIPDRPVLVVRAARIEIRWFDLNGKVQQREMEGDAARIAQHEADHLDGRLIIDIPPLDGTGQTRTMQ
ncbi:peptide deformylase [uncultured Paracoccus sp.]|uniref:peptide deformylase n=1 Tax=uncultured Paracoccus sp. TaxID=189685 RepID=UPI00261B3C9A|nr:peptide deformylase [uncultured Paracoccus sp.]